MLNCEQLERSDWTKYDALVRWSPHGSIFSLSSWEADAVYGVFKGAELIGGCAFRTTPHGMARYVEFTPWQGIVARTELEGENVQIAESLLNTLAYEYGEVNFFFPPQWGDIRPFLWAPGVQAEFRTFVFYTYRGFGQYEKRVVVKPLKISERTTEHGFVLEHELGSAEFISDWRCIYYWKAAGTEHSPLVKSAILRAEEQNLDFDVVGCNSPYRGLFKRGFGGTLTPYFAITSSETTNMRAVPVPSLRSPKDGVRDMSKGYPGGQCAAELSTAGSFFT